MQIYISQGGQRVGPYAVEEVNRQLATGRLNPSDLGWSETSPGWKPLLSFAGVIVPGGASSSPISLAIATPTHWDSQVYAGFWIRAAAFLTDLILLGIFWMGAEPFIYRWIEEGDRRPAMTLIVLRVILSFLYLPIFWASPLQASPGQRMWSVRVIDAITNGRISIWRGIGRVLAMLLSGALGGIGFVMVAFTERKRGLHDRMAGTCVVKSPRGV